MIQVCRYNEIRSVQVIHLLSVWSSGGEDESKALFKKLDEKLDSYAAGELEHAAEAISSIWGLARHNIALPSSFRATPQGHQESSETRGSTRHSLIKSIRGGSLLHRKFWARQSRGGSIRPVYIPSVVSSSMLSRVVACESKHILGTTSTLSWTVVEYYGGGDGHLKRNDEHEFSEDSDRENEYRLADTPASGNAVTGCERQGRELLVPVLKVGSLIA